MIMTIEHTKTPWVQGVTLRTNATLNWTIEQVAANNAIERRQIFSNFSADDEGRNRVLVASCQREETARRIVACVNRCEGVDTETLETSPDLATAFMSAENARLMQVNAGLLAALVEYRNDVKHMLKGRFLDLKTVEHELTTAIVKAEAA